MDPTASVTPLPPGAGVAEHHAVAGDDSRWAFGTQAEDPLAGVDTTVPAGVDAAVLARYCLGLGDDALVASRRLAEWCSRAPDLEEDIALANHALDLLGQARLLLARAAAADPSVVPVLPPGSPVPAEDALAYFRGPSAFRNVHLAEVDHGDFAHVVVRRLLLSVVRLALLERLTGSRDPVLAAVAAKGAVEVAYHRDHAARWFVTLARGTAQSRGRLLAAADRLWPLLPETLRTHPDEEAAALAGIGVRPHEVADDVRDVLDQVLAAAGAAWPEAVPPGGRGGRHGVHTGDLTSLLEQMQSVARAHPTGLW